VGGLGISWQGLVVGLVNFALLLLLLYVFLYKPVLGMLNERQARIKESMERVEEIREQAARTEEQVRVQLEAARREGQAIVAQAQLMGERLKEEAREEARKEAGLLIARARADIEREREIAMDELRAQFVDLALLAAEKVIRETLDKEAHRRLIDEVLEQSGGLKRE